MVSSNDGFFEWCKNYCPTAHVEEAATERGDYERKSGNFLCNEDTPEIRQVRFGVLRENQKEILRLAGEVNDRQITWFIDSVGATGKTFLSVHLWERGKALIVPRSESTAGKISAFLCSAYRGEPYIIVDLPRDSKADGDLYEAIEEIKDGLVFDHRYRGTTRNIRGAKLIVFSNHNPDKKKLSKDRWLLYELTPLGEVLEVKN